MTMDYAIKSNVIFDDQNSENVLGHELRVVYW
jgi:hypothetical protein